MKKRSDTKPPRYGIALRCMVVIIGICLFLIAAYTVGRHVEESQYQPQRGVMSEGFGQLPTMEFEGRTYVKRANQTTFLLMGIDTRDVSRSYGFRRGGQVDFLLLLVLDHDVKSIRQLQIDRDTMTEVIILGALGNDVGTRNLQICLSHCFGESNKENCEYTAKAVQNLLQGMDIDLYMALRLNAVDVLNNALEGVTVKLEDDFTKYDSQMALGKTIKLKGRQAELFVRYRLDVGDGTNESRMKRQLAYMSAASSALRKKMEGNQNFIAALYDTMAETMTTNATRGRMINEIHRVYQYELLPAETLAGNYKIGEDGFMEFHADAQAAAAWIIRVLYAPSD